MDGRVRSCFLSRFKSLRGLALRAACQAQIDRFSQNVPALAAEKTWLAISNRGQRDETAPVLDSYPGAFSRDICRPVAHTVPFRTGNVAAAVSPSSSCSCSRKKSAPPCSSATGSASRLDRGCGEFDIAGAQLVRGNAVVHGPEYGRVGKERFPANSSHTQLNGLRSGKKNAFRFSGLATKKL